MYHKHNELTIIIIDYYFHRVSKKLTRWRKWLGEHIYSGYLRSLESLALDSHSGSTSLKIHTIPTCRYWSYTVLLQAWYISPDMKISLEPYSTQISLVPWIRDVHSTTLPVLSRCRQLSIKTRAAFQLALIAASAVRTPRMLNIAAAKQIVTA